MGASASSPPLVNMSKVYVKADAYKGHGAFARVPIKKGELVESGIVRVHEGLDGDTCPFVFTWSEGEPRKWASGSGASVFYNMCETPNTHMTRNFKQNSFEIHATKDIEKDEELTHVYISATWRKCFADLKPMAEKYLENEKNNTQDRGFFCAVPCIGRSAPKEEPAAGADVEGEVPGVVDMSKVVVRKDAYGGAGAYAKVDIKKGELVEKGIIRRLDLDGNINPFVFTWSEKEPRVWGSGSGASVFYNMCATPNTHMTRDFKNDSFEIHAEKDIKAGEELTHVYISATWRKCFEDLKPMAEEYLANQKAAGN